MAVFDGAATLEGALNASVSAKSRPRTIRMPDVRKKRVPTRLFAVKYASSGAGVYPATTMRLAPAEPPNGGAVTIAVDVTPGIDCRRRSRSAARDANAAPLSTPV